MSFTKKFGTLIHKSDKTVNTLISDNGVILYKFNNNFHLIYKKKIINEKCSFADVWFDIDKDDTLYGLVKLKKGTLIHLYINKNIIVTSNIFKYDHNIYDIKFPYIKKVDKSTHIIYFSINLNNRGYCNLIHHYKKNGQWIKNQIDYINYNILSNFVVIFENSIPNIFYYKIIDGVEEIFLSTFNLTKNTWSNPIQITNSHKPKVYLSVIKDSKGTNHILFSENNFNKYYCTYVNGYIKDNKFIIFNHSVISKTVACTFPNIIEHNNVIYAQWIEYHDLYQSFSFDSGLNWSNTLLDKEASRHPFLSYNYHCNYLKKNFYNLSNIFALENSMKILGINK